MTAMARLSGRAPIGRKLDDLIREKQSRKPEESSATARKIERK